MNRNENLGSVFSRFFSYVIDVLILFAIDTVIFVYINNPNFYYLITVMIQALYFSYFFGKGATPGMNVLDLKLIKTNEKKVNFLTGLIRYIGMIISFMAFLIGFIWILKDNKNQGWHDKLAKTLVIKDLE